MFIYQNEKCLQLERKRKPSFSYISFSCSTPRQLAFHLCVFPPFFPLRQVCEVNLHNGKEWIRWLWREHKSFMKGPICCLMYTFSMFEGEIIKHIENESSTRTFSFTAGRIDYRKKIKSSLLCFQAFFGSAFERGRKFCWMKRNLWDSKVGINNNNNHLKQFTRFGGQWKR